MLEKMKTPSTPSFHAKSSTTRLDTGYDSVNIPDRASSLKTSASRHIAAQTVQPMISSATRLIHAYMVCGLSRDPHEWTWTQSSPASKTQRAHGSVGPSIAPSMLGSIPAHDSDIQLAQTYASAIKAVFPNDAEIMTGNKAPASTCHSFVMQSFSSQSLYGVALRLWVKIDFNRRAKMMEVLPTKGSDAIAKDSIMWMPYCLAYISCYPLFDLLSDYLRCTWILYGKDPDKFNNEAVLPLMRLPPPEADAFLRVSLENFTFCYKLPVDPNKFQNFALWPLFSCLSTQQIIGIVEAALSSHGRIILTSQHMAILTVAAEAIRFYVKTWAGLYVPIVSSKDAQQSIEEPGPYILGVTKQSRSLFTAPREALLVDLDFGRILNSTPPGSLSPRQRKRYAGMLSRALHGAKVEGVPEHLRTTFDKNGHFAAVGAVLTADQAVASVRDPVWWDPVQVEAAMSHIVRRVRRNYKILSALKGVKHPPSTKLSTMQLTELVHDRNLLSRSINDTWRAYLAFRRQSDVKVNGLLQRQAEIDADLQVQRKEYSALSECTEALIEETRQLQTKVNQQMRDNVGISSQLRDKTIHAKQLSNHVTELQSELKEANKTLSVQQELLDEIERSRNNNQESDSDLELHCQLLTQERDEAHRAVIHLTSLISSQITYIERVIQSLVTAPSRPVSGSHDNRKSVRRSFQSATTSFLNLSPVLSQFPSLKAESEATRESRRHTTDFTQNILNPLSAAIASHAAPARASTGSPLSNSELVDDEPTIKEKIGAVAATVQKINEQCRAAVQELAERTTEIHAKQSLPPSSSMNVRNRSMTAGGLRSSSAPPSTTPNAISQLIEQSRREMQEKSSLSSAISGISKVTRRSIATSMASSVPSLTSTAQTVATEILSDNPANSAPVSSQADRNDRAKILPIAEEVDVEAQASPSRVNADPETKQHWRGSSGVLGRAIYS